MRMVKIVALLVVVAAVAPFAFGWGDFCDLCDYDEDYTERRIFCDLFCESEADPMSSITSTSHQSSSSSTNTVSSTSPTSKASGSDASTASSAGSTAAASSVAGSTTAAASGAGSTTAAAATTAKP